MGENSYRQYRMPSEKFIMVVLPPSTVLDKPGGFFLLSYYGAQAMEIIPAPKVVSLLFPILPNSRALCCWDATQGFARLRQALSEGLRLLTSIDNGFR